MNILLTGGNGLLGQNVLRHLLRQGSIVHAIVRKGAKGRDQMLAAIPETHCDTSQLVFHEGSLLDLNFMKSAAWRCHAIIHCAGTTNMALLHLDDYLPVNQSSCKIITQVMEQCGIQTLVHVSTANTIGHGYPDHLSTESEPWRAPFAQSLYAQSKQMGEQVVSDLAKKHPDWHIIIVNPGFMIGPNDYKPSSGQLLLAAYRKPLMVISSGGKSFIPVTDAATAIVNALTRGDNGQRYLLTGQNMSLKQFYQLQSQVCGYRQKVIVPPNWLLLVAGKMGDLMRRMGIHTQLSSCNVSQLLANEYYDNNKAINKLSMTQTPLEKAIRDFFECRSASTPAQ